MGLFLHHASFWGRTAVLNITTRIDTLQLLDPPGSRWQRLRHWLHTPASADAAPAPAGVAAVREEFIAALADIAGDEVDALRERLQQARSLRELWHVRADLFRAVGVAHSQSEAERRLSLINRHFPTRSPRSNWVPL
ncbi:hypothetical protein RA210_U110038 [Rubrivivax sp. A210]|uniref:hypothetical protein n=1 Tax=Rubrivivax sp. A210 TaxID=2772301 RepID=UPI001919154C|nr:hypothetical protein [Rubrivivax sp. A210]CAD5369721.1 hypothetical protein RA210_U110038 [Rubrivivax sp. A210]